MHSKIIAKHAHVTGRGLPWVLVTDQSHKHCLVHQGKAFLAPGYDYTSHHDFLVESSVNCAGRHREHQTLIRRQQKSILD